MLRIDKVGGQLKVSRFAAKVEKEVSETCSFYRKVAPFPSAAPSVIISAIWNAAGIPKQSLLIDKRPHDCFLLTLLKESEMEKFLQRQPFIIYNALLAIDEWNNQVN